MFSSYLNTSFPSYSIYDGGVSSGTVDSMLFSGISSFGNRPLDSYMGELDTTLSRPGNGWSWSGSNFSRFLDTSPLTISRSYDTWGWGGDWGMGYLMRALAMPPFFMPMSDIFEQFKFSSSGDSAFNTTFPPSTIPDYSSSTPSSSSVNSGSSGKLTRATREQPKAVAPAAVNVPEDAVGFVKDISGNGTSVAKPNTKTFVEEINGKRHPAVALQYSKGVRSDEKAAGKLAALLTKELEKNHDLIVVVGGERFSADDSLAQFGVEPPSGLVNAIRRQAELDSQGVVKGNGDVTIGSGQNTFTFANSPGFRVNTDLNSHYYVDASREDGESIIAERFLSQGNREEAWAYVEYKDDTGFHKRWFECGKDEGNGNVTADLSFLSSLQERTTVSAISVYHQHPLKERQSGYSWPSDQDLLSANSRDGIALGISYDTRVVTREGVYIINNPSNPIAEDAIRNGYNKGLKEAVQKDVDSPHTEVISSTGLECSFRHFKAPAADGMASMPEDVRDFIKQYATSGSKDHMLDISWATNGDIYFTIRDDVSDANRNEIVEKMKKLFGGQDNVYLVAGGQTYSFGELGNFENDRGFKKIDDLASGT